MSVTRVHGCRPTLENLEARDLPAYVNLVDGVLQVVGDSWHNEAVVSNSGTKIKVVMESTPADGFSLVPSVITKYFSSTSVTRVKFWGYSGEDYFDNDTSKPSTAYGGTGDDRLFGGPGVDILYGQEDADFLRGYGGKDEHYGGTGYDGAIGVAGEIMYDCESVDIVNLPGGTPQIGNKCGPNSAWRVMKAYGGFATHQELIDRASESSLISKWNLGTTGNTLVNAMNSLRRGLGSKTFSLKTHSSLEDIFYHLRRGRPVVAMIRVEGTEVFKSGIFSYEVPALHWVAVDGFDRAKSLVYYTDTDGERYQQSFASFKSDFNWSFGWVQNKFLQSLGVVEGSFIV